jgi:hypothetical protein
VGYGDIEGVLVHQGRFVHPNATKAGGDQCVMRARVDLETVNGVYDADVQALLPFRSKIDPLKGNVERMFAGANGMNSVPRGVENWSSYGISPVQVKVPDSYLITA